MHFTFSCFTNLKRNKKQNAKANFYEICVFITKMHVKTFYGIKTLLNFVKMFSSNLKKVFFLKFKRLHFFSNGL